jgi:hypothetical protein
VEQVVERTVSRLASVLWRRSGLTAVVTVAFAAAIGGVFVSATSSGPPGQAPSKMLCVPFRLCHDAGRTALRFCRTSGKHTICSYNTDAGAVFQAGRFLVTVRELESRHALAALRVVFLRGLGG